MFKPCCLICCGATWRSLDPSVGPVWVAVFEGDGAADGAWRRSSRGGGDVMGHGADWKHRALEAQNNLLTEAIGADWI